MQLETINKLYLELSQIATAKTEREINLEQKLQQATKTPSAGATCQSCNWVNHSCLNLGNPNEKPVWLCHGCLKNLYERAKTMEDLLRSAHAIAERKGEGTAWDRFAHSIRAEGIGSVTARTYRILPSDSEPEESLTRPARELT